MYTWYQYDYSFPLCLLSHPRSPLLQHDDVKVRSITLGDGGSFNPTASIGHIAPLEEEEAPVVLLPSSCPPLVISLKSVPQRSLMLFSCTNVLVLESAWCVLGLKSLLCPRVVKLALCLSLYISNPPLNYANVHFPWRSFDRVCDKLRRGEELLSCVVTPKSLAQRTG